MLLKVIDENKVKILVEDKDIAENDIPFEKLDYNDKVSREFILSLIQKTYEQTGVCFLDSKVLIEAVPGVSRSYYIMFTRLDPASEQKTSLDKAAKADDDMYIYKLGAPEDVFSVAEHFVKHPEISASRSRIFLYKGAYYLVLDFPPRATNHSLFSAFTVQLGEFALRCKWNIVNEAMLCEWGELIVDFDAIEKAAAALKR